MISCYSIFQQHIRHCDRNTCDFFFMYVGKPEDVIEGLVVEEAVKYADGESCYT